MAWLYEGRDHVWCTYITGLSILEKKKGCCINGNSSSEFIPYRLARVFITDGHWLQAPADNSNKREFYPLLLFPHSAFHRTYLYIRTFSISIITSQVCLDHKFLYLFFSWNILYLHYIFNEVVLEKSPSPGNFTGHEGPWWKILIRMVLKRLLILPPPKSPAPLNHHQFKAHVQQSSGSHIWWAWYLESWLERETLTTEMVIREPGVRPGIWTINQHQGYSGVEAPWTSL